MLTTNDSGLPPVLIDFGKCRKVSNAKWYKLNANKQAKYFKKHWHIAPELVYGTHGQSFASDLFSFGTVMGWVYNSVPLHWVYVCYILPSLSLSLFLVPFISRSRDKLVTMIAHNKVFFIHLSGRVFTQTLQITSNSMVRIHRIFLCGLRLRVLLSNILYLSYQQWNILWEENHNRSGSI